jgi:hypothetical protein
MIVVPVLITNCHVLEKLNNGPLIAQTTIMKKANIEAIGLPDARATTLENLVKNKFVEETAGKFIGSYWLAKIAMVFLH